MELKGSRYPYGGTAFVVGEGLLMTNRHVAEIFAAGLGDRDLRFRPGITAGFSRSFAPSNDEVEPAAVTGIAMIHPYWDMALLKVEGLALAALPLATEDSQGFETQDIAVIGYPAFDPRNDPDVQAKLFDNRYGIKQLQPGKLRPRASTDSFGKAVDAVTHDCSTLGGNSGSSLIHVSTGKVLGLHFGGEYLKRNFAVAAADLAKDARVFDAGVTFAPGARPDVPPSWSGWWRAADTALGATEAVAATETAASAPLATAGPVEVIVPVKLRITRAGDGSSEIALAGGLTLDAATERAVEPAHDADYANRTGYDPMFLGAKVEMPAPASLEAIAPARTGGQRLDYENFSLLMNARRRLAHLTAANVTAEAALKKPEPGRDYSRKGLGGLGERDQERWFTDPRLDARFQLPDVFYTRDDGAFDKGHIVRREDVAWGRSYDTLRRANGDTFHVTNCSPQVAAFNRSTLGRENWGALENVVLGQAGSERLCVFAGPVLDDNDPRFLGTLGRREPVLIQIPIRFWKVIVARAGAGLASFAFLLEQDLADVSTQEFAVPDAFRPFSVPLARIAHLAQIAFPEAVMDADAFEGAGQEVALRAGIGRDRRTGP